MGPKNWMERGNEGQGKERASTNVADKVDQVGKR